MMALRKFLSGRFIHLNRHSSTRASLPPPSINRLPGSTTACALNRHVFLQQRSISQWIRNPPISIGDNLMERIRSSMMPLPVKVEEEERSKKVISAADLRKLLMAWRMEGARAMLREIPSSYVSYSEFLDICRKAAGAGGGEDECAREIATALDHSGAVIVVADVVFLHPDQVGRAIEKVIVSEEMEIGFGRKEELKELEAKKDAIDRKAMAQAKRELWGGLAFVLIQTAGFMRLTFWELSWDVMEPICFFTTSVYFIMGYAFFLRTHKEPSFESFFSTRFAANQKRLFKSHSFDLSRFNHLKTPALPITSSSS